MGRAPPGLLRLSGSRGQSNGRAAALGDEGLDQILEFTCIRAVQLAMAPDRGYLVSLRILGHVPNFVAKASLGCHRGASVLDVQREKS